MKEESNLKATPLRYAGVATLLRRPLLTDSSGVDIALIGVPYDGATENRPGPRHGPREIRNMSSFTRSIHHVTRVNPYELCNVADLGMLISLIHLICTDVSTTLPTFTATYAQLAQCPLA